MTFYVELGRK